jgi:glycosyltransferase involved in cell wall biosynthesis
MKNRTIYLEMAGRLLAVYKSWIADPPEGYTFVSSDLFKKYHINNGATSQRIIDNTINLAVKAGIPYKLFRGLATFLNRPPLGSDLVITNGILDFRDEKWIVVVEEALSSLLGLEFDRKYLHGIVERKLADENCKGIICFNNASKNSLLSTYDIGSFSEKIVTIPVAERPVTSRPKTQKGTDITLLFLGSANFPNPNGFYIKGGHIVARSYIRLKKEFERLKIVFRSVVPDQYVDLLGSIPQVKIIPGALSEHDLEDLLWSCDILVLPCLTTPWMSFINAMNHKIPIVTVDTNANAEVVDHEFSGLVCPTSRELDPVRQNYWIPNKDVLMNIMSYWYSRSEDIVKQVTESVRYLILNEEARLTMGERGRKNIESGGKFSIEKRNSKLKEVLDRALKE